MPSVRSLCLLLLGVAACSGTSTSSVGMPDGGAGGGAGGGEGAAQDGASGTSTPGTSACAWNLPSCGGTCVDLAEDARHCGACGNACATGSVCVEGTCKPGTCADFFLDACGSSCVEQRRHPEHCGACGKACGAGELCLDGACTAVTGSGESCADPLVMRTSKQDEAFSFGGATADEAPLSCGDPARRADKVFRWTATRTKPTKIRTYGGTDADDLVLEVFSAAPCTSATRLACNNDERATTRRPEAELAAEAGRTYFIVVSSFGPPPLGRFYLHVDD